MKTEFEFISELLAHTKTANRDSKIRVGIGDDCAVIRQNSHSDLVVTADLLIEDIDFRLDWSKPEFVGHKTLAVSLSDAAAMGAKPIWAMTSIGIPEKIWETDFVEKFYDGWLRLAKKMGVALIGGDVSRTPDKIVIDSIVAGEVKKSRAVLRSGAEVGDLIFVTGELGGAAAGLRLLENGVRYETAKGWQKNLLLKQLQPFRDFDNAVLGEKKLATAMIDLSDGLSSDLAHLCAASEVGAEIYAGKIPVHKKLIKNVEFKSDALSLALNGGEDFELLFTVDPKKIKRLRKHFPGCQQIGEIVERNQGVTLINQNKKVPLKPAGFQHF